LATRVELQAVAMARMDMIVKHVSSIEAAFKAPVLPICDNRLIFSRISRVVPQTVSL
jgi:hypothetical protein